MTPQPSSSGGLKPTGISYRKLRAPREHGGRLIDPPLDNCVARLSNAQRNVPIQNAIGSELIAAGRRDLRQLLQNTGGELRTLSADATQPIVMTGHQPELFHPGVWFKTFVTDQMAKRSRATAVHVVMDNDIAGDPAIYVPFRSPSGNWVRKRIPFDRTAGEVPHEQRGVIDRGLFTSFPGRVVAAIGDQVDDPIITSLWPHVLEANGQGYNIGDSFVAGRVALERAHGLQVAHVRMSDLANSASFAELCLLLIRRMPEFFVVHNRALHQYRKVHGIRSSLQPLPDLKRDGDWFEFPCWSWSNVHPARQRVFVRRRDSGFTVTDLTHFEFELSLNSARALQQWRDASQSGCKLRPRALLATLYFRLLLSDLFVHGIGGAKYDQVTDEIVRQFWGVEPPDFMTATSTYWLPIPHDHLRPDKIPQLRAELRNLQYHPERFVSTDADNQMVQSLITEKRYWTVGSWAESHSPAERHREVGRINAELRKHVRDIRRATEQALSDVLAKHRACSVLDSREYAFCLYDASLMDQLRKPDA